MKSVTRSRSRSARGRSHEHGIPRLVAVAVVDLLEAVEVEHEHRPGLLVPARMRQPVGELPNEPATVGDRGQLIVHGKVTQHVLALPALGDVLKLSQPAQRPSLGVAQEGQVGDRPHDAPCRRHEALLRLPGIKFAVEDPPRRVNIGLAVVGMGELLVAPADQIRARATEQAAQGVVDSHVPTFGVKQSHAQRRHLEGDIEHRTRLAYELGAGDLAQHHHALLPSRSERYVNADGHPIRPVHPHADRLVAGEAPWLEADELPHRHPAERQRIAAQQTAGGGVGGQHAPVRVDEERGSRQGLEGGHR